jgi:hypothetical protein
MHRVKLLRYVTACLMIIGSVASYARSLLPIVDFDRLFDTPEKFDGKLVRVRGFMKVEINPRDVSIILLYPSKKQAVENPGQHCILIGLENSRIGGMDAFKSGWVEITARFVSVPAGRGGHIPALAEIQKLEELGEDPGNH